IRGSGQELEVAERAVAQAVVAAEAVRARVGGRALDVAARRSVLVDAQRLDPPEADAGSAVAPRRHRGPVDRARIAAAPSAAGIEPVAGERVEERVLEAHARACELEELPLARPPVQPQQGPPDSRRAVREAGHGLGSADARAPAGAAGARALRA